MLWQGVFIHTWSKTLATLALSSGEAELGAVVRGATEGLGITALLGDFGLTCPMVIRSDATAAIGMVKRLGLGRVRHLAVADLWVQQKLRRGAFTISKWPGVSNPSDMMTKYLSCDDTMKFLKMLTFHPLAGRAQVTPSRGERWKADQPVSSPACAWTSRAEIFFHSNRAP